MNRPIITVTTVAALLAAGSTSSLYAQVNTTRQDRQQTQQQVQQERQQVEALRNQLTEAFPQDAVQIPDREPTELRTETTQMVRDALHPERLVDALTQLSRVNRNELGQVSPQQQQVLVQELQALSQAFQQVYGEQLNLDRAELFPNAALVRAEVRDARELGNLPLRPMAMQGAGNRDVALDAGETTDDQRGIGNRRTQQRQQQAQQASQQYGATAQTYGIDRDSRLGLMGIPMAGQNQHLIVTAVEESRPAAGEMGGEWRLIIPMGLTADQLAQNLAQHVRRMRETQNQWPEDADRARELLGQRALLAFYNLDPAGANGDVRQQQQLRQQQQQQRNQQQQRDWEEQDNQSQQQIRQRRQQQQQQRSDDWERDHPRGR